MAFICKRPRLALHCEVSSWVISSSYSLALPSPTPLSLSPFNIQIQKADCTLNTPKTAQVVQTNSNASGVACGGRRPQSGKQSHTSVQGVAKLRKRCHNIAKFVKYVILVKATFWIRWSIFQIFSMETSFSLLAQPPILSTNLESYDIFVFLLNERGMCCSHHTRSDRDPPSLSPTPLFTARPFRALCVRRQHHATISLPL